MNICTKYENTDAGNCMIQLMNEVSGFNFFAGELDWFYGLDEQLDTCVWSPRELKAFPEVKIVPISELIITLKSIKNNTKQLQLGL